MYKKKAKTRFRGPGRSQPDFCFGASWVQWVAGRGPSAGSSEHLRCRGRLLRLGVDVTGAHPTAPTALADGAARHHVLGRSLTAELRKGMGRD